MQIGVEEGLDARVGGTETIAQQLILLVVIAQQGAGDVQELRIGGAAAGGQAERCQLEIDVANQFLITLRRHYKATPAQNGSQRDKTWSAQAYPFSLLHRGACLPVLLDSRPTDFFRANRRGPRIYYCFMNRPSRAEVSRRATTGRFAIIAVLMAARCLVAQTPEPGTMQILFRFSSTGPNGCSPNSLLLGDDGNFYGTTRGCGANNSGTVFKMTTGGQLTILHSFTGGDDGAFRSGPWQ